MSVILSVFPQSSGRERVGRNTTVNTREAGLIFAISLVLFSPFGRTTEKIRGRQICEDPQM